MDNKFKIMSGESIILLMAVGLTAGVLSGLVGVGGGIIIVPALIFFLGFTQLQAQGTSLGLLLLPVGIFAVINYYKAGHIDLKVVGVMSIAFVAGGWLGSKLALRLDQEVVKKIFAVVLFYTAFRLLHWDTVFIKWVKELF
ncbi:MAG TPA: sulfite exporter TauE/SafE family protein [Chitinophagaceae bacterium]|nr:sulfite exporter TauE/SafE family protein [Chitinophagaceae bacterium]